MTYTGDERTLTAKKLGLFLVTIIAAFLGAAIARVGFGFVFGPEEATVQKFDELVMTDNNMRHMYQTLKTEFPADYDELAKDVTDHVNAGADREQAFNHAKAAMQRLLLSHRSEFAAAPTPYLLKARDANIEVIETLAAESPSTCANFAMIGLQSTDRPSEKALHAISDAGAALINAAAAGMRDPVSRKKVSEEDVLAYTDAMSNRGLSDQHINGFLGGTGFGNISREEECRIGLAIYRSLADLNDEASARMSAELLMPGNQL